MRMFLLLLFLAVMILAEEISLQTPNLTISVDCDPFLRKSAFEICYSCRAKRPKLAYYVIDGSLANKKNLSRDWIRFMPDYQLPIKCRSYPRDYSRTGFDRGHLAPNAAFDYNRKVQEETFLMSNIAPQKPKLNRKYWAKVERFVRIQARKYGKVSVLTGVCGFKGKLRNGVVIPAVWYKIVDRGSAGIVAFMAPNTNKGMERARLRDFLTSLDRIEEYCGLKFRSK